MSLIYRFCDCCGPSSFPGIHNIAVARQDCPQCSIPGATPSDGYFVFHKGGISTKTSFSRETLNELRRIVEEAAHKQPEVDDLLSKVHDASPGLAAALRDKVTDGFGWWMILFIIAFLLNNVKIDVRIDLNEIISQASVAARQQENIQSGLQLNFNYQSEIINNDARVTSTTSRLTKRQARRHRGQRQSR